MNKITTLILLAGFSAAISASGQAGSAPGAAGTSVATNVAIPPPASVPTQVGAPTAAATAPATSAGQPLSQSSVEDTNAPALAGTNVASSPQVAAGAPTDAATPTPGIAAGTNGLRLNFRGASLDQVLNYLSEAAGFIIVLDAQPRGRVDVFSNTPVTKEEAVNLLNQALKKNGYAAIRNGRTLTIVPRDEAKIHDIPVFVGGDPDTIPKTDDIVTQIIPVRFVEVAQLVKDIQPLISTQTTMTANESGNEIIITDTQANIHKVAEIIKAIDAGAEDITVVRVFRLNYADPSEMSDLLVNLFPDDSRSGGSSSPVQFGGFGGFRSFFRGGGGPPGGSSGGSSGGSNNQNQRIKKRARVVAVADPRTSSLVVSSARDLMDQIESVVSELDSNPAQKKTVKVFKIDNADPQQAMQVLQDIFQKNGSANGRNSMNQNSVLTQRSLQQSSQSGTGSGSSTRRSNSGSTSFGQ